MRELSKIEKREAQSAAPQHTMQRDGSRKRLLRRLAVFLAFALTVVVSLNVTFYKQKATIAEKQGSIAKLKQQADQLDTEEKQLKDEVNKLNDDEYIAEIARRDYFFSNKNETIFPLKGQ
ncbi:FtsB family cell division protein [Ectobacillus ponti]|uniref:Septum formation initiator family protein n=1 Tax=Ectobacillus ponti TaxID=2961894 RepID=A0AA42BSA1_9BACI|nr:septum formation initiator family protein [Ectobacillus ponti]MCP8971171.1 septum formation initiator family protein [Ectobacillus ponti]